MVLTKNGETQSEDNKTIVESPTPAPETVFTDEVALKKREEFVRLFIATVFADKDAAIETFTVENIEMVSCLCNGIYDTSSRCYAPARNLFCKTDE